MSQDQPQVGKHNPSIAMRSITYKGNYMGAKVHQVSQVVRASANNGSKPAKL